VRHNYATAALKAGISAKVISERLGHTSVAFTLQTYGRVIPGMDKDAAVTVADLILTSMQKGPGTVVPGPSANKTANADSRAVSSIPFLGLSCAWSGRTGLISSAPPGVRVRRGARMDRARSR
jgi:hypothetical protein